MSEICSRLGINTAQLEFAIRHSNAKGIQSNKDIVEMFENIEKVANGPGAFHHGTSTGI